MTWFQTRDFLQEVRARPSFCTGIDGKKAKVDHVRILKAGMFSSLMFFSNFLSHELFLTGPSAIELALDISSGSPYSLVYYTYYQSTAPPPSNFQILQCTGTELKRIMTGISCRQTAVVY